MSRTGGPEVMEYVDVEVGPPGPGEATVRHEAIGLITWVSLDGSMSKAVIIRSGLASTDGLYDAENPRSRFRR